MIKKRYLFVCSANIHRSKTAEHFFKKHIYSDYEFKSCGTDLSFIEKHKKDWTSDSTPISKDLCEWAEVILCMEDEHADFVEYHYGKEMRKKAHVLKIQDLYEYNQSELKRILENKVKFGLTD